MANITSTAASGTQKSDWATGNDVTAALLNADADAFDAHTHDVAAATEAQGTLADSAVQPGDNVSGLTNDSGFLTADVAVADGGTGASDAGTARNNLGVFPGNIGAATEAQGALADSAVQPGDNVSNLTNDAGFITATHDHDVPDIVAVAAVTIDQDDVVVVGRGAAGAQTVELRHVSADGQTVTLMQTVIVTAGSEAAQTPASFSRAFVRGDRFRVVRTAGTGSAPVVTVAA